MLGSCYTMYYRYGETPTYAGALDAYSLAISNQCCLTFFLDPMMFVRKCIIAFQPSLVSEGRELIPAILTFHQCGLEPTALLDLLPMSSPLLSHLQGMWPCWRHQRAVSQGVSGEHLYMIKDRWPIWWTL